MVSTCRAFRAQVLVDALHVMMQLRPLVVRVRHLLQHQPQHQVLLLLQHRVVLRRGLSPALVMKLLHCRTFVKQQVFMH